MAKASGHSEKQSQFFKCRSKVKLASFLFCDLKKLKEFAEKDYYHSFQKEKKSGGVRTICAPRNDLKRVQARIADLLQRIVPPDYLFAPVSGRSYIDNAAIHNGAKALRLLDIEDFFPNCTDNRVLWFFHKRMSCSIDIAYILKGIVTYQGALPQGSPCSPILAFLCYIDMWEQIEELVRAHDCSLSVYADDLTISGNLIPEAMIWEIKEILHKYGHRYNAEKERSRYLRPAEVTGVVLTNQHLALPNRQRLKLIDARKQLRSAKSEREKRRAKSQVVGRESQINQIIKRNSTS